MFCKQKPRPEQANWTGEEVRRIELLLGLLGGNNLFSLNHVLIYIVGRRSLGLVYEQLQLPERVRHVIGCDSADRNRNSNIASNNPISGIDYLGSDLSARKTRTVRARNNRSKLFHLRVVAQIDGVKRHCARVS